MYMVMPVHADLPTGVHCCRMTTLVVLAAELVHVAYEHRPHPLGAPLSLDVRVTPALLSTPRKVFPVHVAPAMPHVPSDSVVDDGTVTAQSTYFLPMARSKGVHRRRPGGCGGGLGGGGGRGEGGGGDGGGELLKMT